MASTNQQNFGQRTTELRKAARLTQKQLADQLEVSITSVQNYEAGRIPNGEILVKLAEALGCTPEWIVTGEGEMMRGASTPAPQAPAAAPQRLEANIYNDAGLKKSNISDLVAKTIEVLQSNTVFQFALESNIEAFHQAIILERKIDQVEGALSKRLDALEADNKQILAENQQIKTENAQLKTELAASRVHDGLSDTG